MTLKDSYFIYFLLAQVAAAAVLYGVRLAVSGAAHSERVSRIGGTALVSQDVMDWTYWAVSPFVRASAALGITANGLTWTALLLGVGAGIACGFGWLGLAALLATWSTIYDILDGQVARLTNTGSNYGELLDAAIDRYTEFAFLAGLVIWYRTSLPAMALALGAMLASYMVSYASAKAEAMQVETPRGLMRRHERAVYLLAGAGFTVLLGPTIHEKFSSLPADLPLLFGLAMVAVVGNYAAVARFVRIGRALR